MLPPALFLRDNLMWTRSGTVWATWRLNGVVHGLRTTVAAQLALLQHQALFQALRGEVLLLGVRSPRTASAVVERLGHDVGGTDWRREVGLIAADLHDRPAEERSYWLSIPLASSDLRGRFRAIATTVGTELRDALALPRRTPSPESVNEAERMAARIAESIPDAFDPQPATPHELIWLSERAYRRGLDGTDGDARPEAILLDGRFVSGAALGDGLIDEGGATDRDAPTVIRNPFARRYVKVHGANSPVASYQQLMALTSGPKDGWAVPGSAWLGAVDAMAEPIDWAVRLTISTGATVQRRNRSAELSLRDQALQQSAESDDLMIGHGAHLSEVATSLRDYAAALSRSEHEVEVQATVILAVAAGDPAETLARARAVRERLALSELRFDPQLGAQAQLWWAMQPGIPSRTLIRELAQLTTGREFASTLPLAASELGDDTGLVLGENLGTGRRSPVLLDLDAAIQADRSASIGIVAELGAGKSFTLKKIAGDSIDRGARVFLIDRTEAREYATFAQSLLPGNTAVVDLVNPSVSLDPLRLFGPAAGARYVQALFATLLGLRPRDEPGVELARLIDALQSRGKLQSLPKLRAELDRVADGPSARRLRGLIDLIANSDFGRVLFDDRLPALDLSARAIIPLTAGLALPTAQELDRQHLFEELPLEKTYGRAMYALLTGIARQLAFTTSELFVFGADECHHITTSPEGEGYVLDFLRDGRKHNALAVLASHDPHDFGDVRARGLIPLRLVMRHTDPLLAERALAWMARGLEHEPDLVRELTENTSPPGKDGTVEPGRRGEALFRDGRQRIGKIRVTPPFRPDRRAALGSTPRPAVTAPDRARTAPRGKTHWEHP